MSLGLALRSTAARLTRFGRTNSRLDYLTTLILLLNEKVTKMSDAYSDLAAQVAATVSVEEKAVVLLSGVNAKLAALQAQLTSQGVNVSSLVQMRADLASETQKLADAMTAEAGDPASAAPAPSEQPPVPAEPAPAPVGDQAPAPAPEPASDVSSAR